MITAQHTAHKKTQHIEHTAHMPFTAPSTQHRNININVIIVDCLVQMINVYEIYAQLLGKRLYICSNLIMCLYSIIFIIWYRVYNIVCNTNTTTNANEIKALTRVERKKVANVSDTNIMWGSSHKKYIVPEHHYR